MAEKEDRISSLPDHLLLEIISRIKIMDKGKQEERLMSTKEVIKTTTTISKLWRHLWTLLPTLVFIDDDYKINRRYHSNDFTKYILFIDKALTQCPADSNLKKFKVDVDEPTIQVNRWIRYAITRNVQEIDLRITYISKKQSCDDHLFFNNSCLISMEVSCCIFNPPNGTIRWDKLKFLRIDEGELDEVLIGKILSGSPCLETLEFNNCYLGEHIPKSSFGNFEVVERLSCDLEAYASFILDDELFLDNSYPFMSMKILRCVFNPPTGALRCDKLNFLCIHQEELDEDLIECILSGSPFLETFQLKYCCGFSRIDITSKSVKNLVLSGYSQLSAGYYIDKLELNAPYISSLTIEEKMYLEELLLQDVSSLVKAELDYWVEERFMEKLGRDRYVVEEELLRGLLSSLGHVNEIALGTFYNCTLALSRLEARGFQFRKASYLRGIQSHGYRVFSLNQK